MTAIPWAPPPAPASSLPLLPQRRHCGQLWAWLLSSLHPQPGPHSEKQVGIRGQRALPEFRAQPWRLREWSMGTASSTRTQMQVLGHSADPSPGPFEGHPAGEGGRKSQTRDGVEPHLSGTAPHTHNPQGNSQAGSHHAGHFVFLVPMTSQRSHEEQTSISLLTDGHTGGRPG